jgi:hypothetical protein
MDYISFRFMLTMFSLLDEEAKVLKKCTLLPQLLRTDIGLGVNAQRTYCVFFTSYQNVRHSHDESLGVHKLSF